MARYLLVRHASATSQLAGSSLTDRGRAEGKALARRLRGFPIQTVWSSDLRRATQTSEILLAGRDDADLLRSPLLREVEPPPEGMLGSDPTGYAAWERKVTAELAGRLSEWLRTATDAERSSPHPDHRSTGEKDNRGILVVSHAGPLRVLICLLLGLPPEAHWSFRLDCASLSMIECGDGMGTLLLLNDRCHLDERRSAG